MTRVRLLLLILPLLLAGCATLAQRDAPALCLPPGIADVPPPSAMTSAERVRTPYGPGMLIHYRVEDQAIDVLWVNGEPIAVDPDASDMAVPVWIRMQREPCTWVSEIVGA